MQDPFSWHQGLSHTRIHTGYMIYITYLVYNTFGMTGIYSSNMHIISVILGLTVYRVNREVK